VLWRSLKPCRLTLASSFICARGAECGCAPGPAIAVCFAPTAQCRVRQFKRSRRAALTPFAVARASSPVHLEDHRAGLGKILIVSALCSGIVRYCAITSCRFRQQREHSGLATTLSEFLGVRRAAACPVASGLCTSAKCDQIKASPVGRMRNSRNRSTAFLVWGRLGV
jgi:hypothetical protein